jgi:hypothetical protein
MGFSENNKEIVRHLAASASAEMRSVIKVMDMMKEICDKEEHLKEVGKSVDEHRKAAYTLLGGMGSVSTEIEEVIIPEEDEKV